MRTWLLLLALWGLACTGAAQDRYQRIAEMLEAAEVDHPGLEGAVEMSVSGTDLGEFVRALGLSHGLNLSVDPAVKGEVVNAFQNARVSDVLLYLCKQYDLELELIGSIIALRPHVAEAPPPPAPTWRPPVVVFAADSGWIDLDLKGDSLGAVARAITLATGTNVVLAPGLDDRPVRAFLRRTSLAGALDKLAFANGLLVERGSDGTFLLRAQAAEPTKAGERGSRGAQTGGGSGGELELGVLPDGLLSVHARQAPIAQVIEQASAMLDKDYFFYDGVEGTATLHMDRVSYEDLLTGLLRGTALTHHVNEGVHLVGRRDLEGLRRTELVRLLNRPVKDLSNTIPEAMRKDVTLHEFVELNGIIVSGDAHRIDEIKGLLRGLDQAVPVVMIEVMIVDVNRSRTVSGGIQMGVGEPPEQSGGTLLPGIDYTLNAGTINNLIQSFNGFGLFNLGNVTPSFYVGIRALEADGVLRMRSTPQLSTLNGHEATLSIGETEFYLEVRNDLIGTQNPTVSTSQIYKPINADLSLRILPMVSSDDLVTLEIEVNQSNFTQRIAATAPPGSVERKFSSIVRVRDRDMIVLGGLEEKENSRSGNGLPLLSRIPVLKWIFGNRSSKRGRSKLTIFIRPTIIL
ncbi:MAG TPA: type II and III secretion system protein [Flavobacteriales bacterium]|nr:type II and III secretion system protein [Flavobacteriales bacterium]HMR28513.1 type II and III secretion system protein [Flavobacteriales bacterium]